MSMSDKVYVELEGILQPGCKASSPLMHCGILGGGGGVGALFSAAGEG